MIKPWAFPECLWQTELLFLFLHLVFLILLDSNRQTAKRLSYSSLVQSFTDRAFTLQEWFQALWDQKENGFFNDNALVASSLVKRIVSLNLSFPPVKQFSPNMNVTFEVHGRLWLIRGGNLIFCSSPLTCTFSLKRLTFFEPGDGCSSPGHQQMAPNNVQCW